MALRPSDAPIASRLLSRRVSQRFARRPFWVITAMNYFVDPFDLIPDEVPFLGFVDDATVMAFAVGRTRQTLDDFMTWETTAF